MKLILNSYYGKSSQKTIKLVSKFINAKYLDRYIRKNYNKIDNTIDIKCCDKLYDKMIDNEMLAFKGACGCNGITEVREKISLDKQFSLIQFGINMLAMNKRIMNEVMCLADDLDIRIFCQVLIQRTLKDQK